MSNQPAPGAPPISSNVMAEAKAVVAAIRESMPSAPVSVDRESLGQLPTQDPPRQHAKL